MEKVEEGDQGEEVIGLNNQVAKPLPNGRNGVCFNGWIVESFKKPILNSPSLQEAICTKPRWLVSEPILIVVLQTPEFVKSGIKLDETLFLGTSNIHLLFSNKHARRRWEENLGVKHLPEMVFGHSSLVLHHIETGIKIYFNAFNALSGWKQEALPPVEVPAAAKWKFRSKPQHQVILDYDYTFTTPYCGSETLEPREELTIRSTVEEQRRGLSWEDCDERIDISALGSKEPIVFFDELPTPKSWSPIYKTLLGNPVEGFGLFLPLIFGGYGPTLITRLNLVVLYEDELADNGVSLLTVKVRVMPSCWFLLLRFWLRVDGVLMRLRDTRVFCTFSNKEKIPTILRECCWRECKFKDFSAGGFATDSALYGDPSLIVERLPVILRKTQKLKLSI